MMANPVLYHGPDPGTLVLAVIAAVYPGHVDLSIQEKRVWGGVSFPVCVTYA